MMDRMREMAMVRSPVSLCFNIDRTTEKRRPTSVCRLTNGIVRGPTAYPMIASGVR